MGNKVLVIIGGILAAMNVYLAVQLYQVKSEQTKQTQQLEAVRSKVDLVKDLNDITFETLNEFKTILEEELK